jgi:hypothetical protein
LTIPPLPLAQRYIDKGATVADGATPPLGEVVHVGVVRTHFATEPDDSMAGSTDADTQVRVLASHHGRLVVPSRPP